MKNDVKQSEGNRDVVSATHSGLDVMSMSPASSAAFVPTVVMMSTDLLSEILRGSFRLAQALRSELSHRVVAGIDWVDHGQQGAMKFGRETVQGLEAVSANATALGEQLCLGLVEVVRRSTLGSLELTGRLTGRLIGSRVDANAAHPLGTPKAQA